MSTIVISIGRNNGTLNPVPIVKPGESLPEATWRAFMHEILVAASQAGLVKHFTGVGTGVYEGAMEESWTAIYSADLDDEEIDSLSRSLALIGFRYGQDSVAVTVGETAFASALVA